MTTATITLSLLALLPRFGHGLQQRFPQQQPPLSLEKVPEERRAFLQQLATGALGLGSATTTVGLNLPAVAAEDDGVSIPIKPSFSVYEVKTDATASLEPSLNSLTVSAKTRLATL